MSSNIKLKTVPVSFTKYQRTKRIDMVCISDGELYTSSPYLDIDFPKLAHAMYYMYDGRKLRLNFGTHTFVYNGILEVWKTKSYLPKDVSLVIVNPDYAESEVEVQTEWFQTALGINFNFVQSGTFTDGVKDGDEIKIILSDEYDMETTQYNSDVTTKWRVKFSRSGYMFYVQIPTDFCRFKYYPYENEGTNDVTLFRQQYVEDLLLDLNGYSYIPYSATGIQINPAYEIGDTAQIEGMFAPIYESTLNFNNLFYSDISAPNTEELEASERNSHIKIYEYSVKGYNPY